MSAFRSGAVGAALESRWRSPLVGRRFDTTVALRPEEVRAIDELGVRNLRRLQCHDPAAPGWRVIRRLLRPVEVVNAGLDSPPTPHRRRAMLDVIAVLLVRGVGRRAGPDGGLARRWSSGRSRPRLRTRPACNG